MSGVRRDVEIESPPPPYPGVLSSPPAQAVSSTVSAQSPSTRTSLPQSELSSELPPPYPGIVSLSAAVSSPSRGSTSSAPPASSPAPPASSSAPPTSLSDPPPSYCDVVSPSSSSSSTPRGGSPSAPPPEEPPSGCWAPCRGSSTARTSQRPPPDAGATQQSPPQQTISLTEVESHEINRFPQVKWKQFAFLDYSKKVALFGKRTEGGVHIFALEQGGRGGRERYIELIDQRLPAPCTHQWSVEMTSLSLGTLGYSYLIFTCYACKNIKMVDVDHKKTYMVHSSGYKYNLICSGGEDVVFLYNFEDPFEVLYMKTGCTNFEAVPYMNLESGMSSCSAMCFLPAPHIAVVLCSREQRLIRAISLYDNRTVWSISGAMAGAACRPRGILYLKAKDVILVNDTMNSRVLVMDPRNGNYIQSMPIPACEEILGLCPYQSNIVMWKYFKETNKYKVSIHR